MTPLNCVQFFEFAMKQIPRESCAVLVIENGIETLCPCTNISDCDNQFVLDPRDYLAATKRGEVVGVVHSHCFIPPIPSDADRVGCEESGVPWHILSVPTGVWYSFEPTGYVAPLLGRQWSHGSLDCYGLVRDYYSQRLGIRLPDFSRNQDWWEKGDNLYCSENLNLARFSREVDPADVKEHDVLLMQVQSKVINHAGIYLGGDMFLHHLNKRLSSRDLWAGYWKKHTVKIVRYQ